MVQQALAAQGLDLRVVELAESSRTAVEAARAVGCELGQIVKSLVFQTRQNQAPLLVTASGCNRVSEKKIKLLLGESICRADADFVRAHTGFAIGGVAPLGHPRPIRTYIDEDLLQYPRIWAAAGTPHALFDMSPAELKRITNGTVADIKD